MDVFVLYEHNKDCLAECADTKLGGVHILMV